MARKHRTKYDAIVDIGSVATLTCASESALEWVCDNISEFDVATPDTYPSIVYCDRRMIGDIVYGMREDGLRVEVSPFGA